MHHRKHKTSVLFRLITLLPLLAAVATTGLFARRSKPAKTEEPELDETGPSLVEHLVAHNTQGF